MHTIIDDFKFNKIVPKQWNGRYGRISGNYSVFHVCHHPELEWWPCVKWEKDDEIHTLWAHYSDDTKEMVQAINSAKNRMFGNAGGSFVINEYCQIIVPASDGFGERFFIGNIAGRLLFEDENTNEILDMSDAENLRFGDNWPKPYIGSIYNLRGNGSEIYHWNKGENSSPKELPPQQDINLIRTLRKIRRSGPIKFIVNPWGIVLTKIPPKGAWMPEEKYQAVYIGRINYNCWFKKEN